MTFETLKVLTTVSSASILVPLIIALFRFRHLNKTQRLLTFLIIASSITETLAVIFKYQVWNNMPVYNTYAIVNFNLIFLIYLAQVKKSYVRYMVAFQIAFNLFAIINASFIQSYLSFNSNLIVTASVVFLLLSLNYFYKLLKEVKYQRLEKTPLFWLNAGIIIYYSGTLILFLLVNQVSNSGRDALNLQLASWGLNSFFNLILNTSYCIALWVRQVK